MNIPEVEKIRQAFFDFLADSQIENDGDPETGNRWYAAAPRGIQFDALCQALGYSTPVEALVAASAWEDPRKRDFQ